MILKDSESVDIPTSTGPMRTYLFRPAAEGRYPGLVLFSEIFQVTGPAAIRLRPGSLTAWCWSCSHAY
jgi:dienelactone hydrolase